MRIFLDTANVEQIRQGAKLGVISGVTTNPSLVSKEATDDYETVVKTICSIISGSVSAEVLAEDAESMIEEAQIKALFHRARHPYTQGLIASIPFYQDLDGPLYSIPGTAPDPHALPEGCRFADRCRARIEHALTICDDTLPDLLEYGTDHAVRCWLYQTGPNHIPPFTLD